MKSVTYKIKSLSSGALRPMVPVLIVNPDTGERLRTDALIDTGADACSFPKFIAESTGHNLKGVNVKSSVNSGISGVKITTWKHSFVIMLLDPTGNKVLRSTSRELIDCFDHNNAPPLIGVKNFLKDLIVELNYPNKEIKISWH